MKLKEVDERLAELFPGKYRSVQYELSTYSNGETKVVCAVYIAEKGWAYRKTFAQAIEDLLNPMIEEPQDIDDNAGGE